MVIVKKSLKVNATVKGHKSRSFKSFKRDGLKLNAAKVKLDAKNAHQNAAINQSNSILLQGVITETGIAVTEAINMEKKALTARNAAYSLMGTEIINSLRALKIEQVISAPHLF